MFPPDDDKFLKDFLNKDFIKFYLTIYKRNNTKNHDNQYMIDLQMA